MNFRVIVTLGPACLSRENLTAIDALGSCIYRINGAHVGGEEAAELVTRVRDILPAPALMIDLPGNKIRTHKLSEPIRLVHGKRFELRPSQVNFPKLYTLVKPGDRILANDSVFSLTVVDVRGDDIIIESHSDGLLHSGKGIHIQGITSELPFLFDRDRDLVRVAREMQVAHLSLSFVRSAEDVREVKRLLKDLGGSDVDLVPKIETRAAVDNLGHILGEVARINVDRGDLSSEVGMLRLPQVQERIIESACRAKKDLFLATQFLKNMEDKPLPLIAEVIDLFNTVKTGIAGIQLSEETAIGKYPVETVKQVFDTYHASFSA